MSTTAYLGLDVGGTSAKAGVFDEEGHLVGFWREGYSPTVSPEGHAEIPIETIYEAARAAARQAIAQSGAHVAALCVSSQGQTFVALDEQGHPVHPAILWYDSRAANEAVWLQEAIRAGVRSGPMPSVPPIASAPKILWLRQHRPEAMCRARRFLLLPDYFAYRLTGEAVTDPITASTTGLSASEAMDYCEEALAAAQIEKESLARIQPIGTPVGPVTPAAAEEWNLAPGALLVVGTNDQYAGALGAGNVRPGILSETTGTCLALVTLVEALPDPCPPGLLGGHSPIPPYRVALAYSKTAGLVLEWFQKVFCPDCTLGDLEALAAEAPIGSGGITMLPHFDGMVSPHPNPAVRGAFVGLTLQHSLGDLYRAVLEGLAFSLRENLEFLQSLGMEVEVIRSIGGGAKSDLWLQIKADVTGLPVERPAVTEAATLGAAMLAAAGHGRYPSPAACSTAWYRSSRTFAPDATQRARYDEAYRAYRDLLRKLYGVPRS